MAVLVAELEEGSDAAGLDDPFADGGSGGLESKRTSSVMIVSSFP